MTEHSYREDDGFQALDASAGLYHEPQADGVPYDEEPDSFRREHQNQTRS